MIEFRYNGEGGLRVRLSQSINYSTEIEKGSLTIFLKIEDLTRL